ncbi:MAG: TVP38/TMEM64 family protein [Acetobacteraceae bacterium]|nr:TVP38/TMEM64 family protein [Acetobacteraceae bacterium]
MIAALPAIADLLHHPLAVLRENRDALIALAQQNAAGAWIGLFALYVLLTSLTLPLNVPLALAAGLMFGFWKGWALVSLGTSCGATVSCLLSRTLLRGWVQRHLGRRIADIQAGMARDGWLYLLSLRLMPIVPYTVVNLVFGLTSMPLRRFFAATWFGTLPATAAYVNAGTALHILDADHLIVSPRLLVSLAVLSLLPVTIFHLRQAISRRRNQPIL